MARMKCGTHGQMLFQTFANVNTNDEIRQRHRRAMLAEKIE